MLTADDDGTTMKKDFTKLVKYKLQFDFSYD